MKRLLFYSLLLPLAGFSQWQGIGSGFGSSVDFVLDMSVVDSNTIWALGSNQNGIGSEAIQVFSLTTNGGQTFETGDIDEDDTTLNIYGIHGFNATWAWAYGNHIPFIDSSAMYETSDGGDTWHPMNFPFLQTTRPAGFHFLNGDSIIVYGGPLSSGLANTVEIWYSWDFGNNWTHVPDSVLNLLPNEQIITISPSSHPAINEGIIWFGTSRGRIFKSADAGKTWETHTLPSTDPIVSMTFRNKDVGIAATNDVNFNSTLYRTSDGGSTWTLLNTGSIGVIPLTVYYVPGTINLMALGINGFAVSYNDGTSWSAEGPNFVYTSVDFHDKNTGWAGGPVLSPTIGGIFKWTGDSIYLGLREERVSEEIDIYPNPAMESLHFREDGKALFFDYTGKIRLVKTVLSDQPVDISGLTSGMYIIQFTNHRGECGSARLTVFRE